MLRHGLPVDPHADHPVPGFDLHSVPLALPLRSYFSGGERVHAAGRIFIPVAIQQLNLIPDMRRRGLGKSRQIGPRRIRLSDRVVRARAVADRHSAVAIRGQPILQVKIELAVSDALAPQVVETIQQVASTDAIGDGKIFVLELASATRIRTGETGDTAL